MDKGARLHYLGGGSEDRACNEVDGGGEVMVFMPMILLSA